MGILTSNVDSTIRKIRKRPDVPGWFIPAGVVLLVGFILYAFPQALNSNNNEQAEAPIVTTAPIPLANGDNTVTPTTSGPVEQTPTPLPTTPTAPPASNATVEVPDISGAAVQIPRTAFESATLAAKAQISGDTTGFTVAPNTPPPLASGTITPEATVNLKVVISNSSFIVFDAGVDPDGSGPEATRYFSIRMANQAESWVYTV